MSIFSTQKPPENGLFLASRRPPPPGPPQDLCSGPLPTLKSPKDLLYTIPHAHSQISSLLCHRSSLYLPGQIPPISPRRGTQNPLSGLGGVRALLGRGLKNADIAYIGIYIQYQGGMYTPLTPPKPDRVSCVPHPASRRSGEQTY